MNYLKTNLDGLGNIKTNDSLEKDNIIYIEDDIYDTPDLYKVKKIDNGTIELKLIKTFEFEIMNEEEIEKYKPNKLFKTNVLNDLVFIDRIQKGQIVVINNKFYEVVDTQKQGKNEPKLLSLEPLNFKKTNSTFPVKKRCKETGETEVFKITDSWKEGIRCIREMREKQDNYYYFF